MHLDEPFPLEDIPHRVGRVLLREFKGRCPSVREVDEIPDKNWLATPGIGSASLQIIRSITTAARQQEVSQIASHRLWDGELLRRLEGLQEDLRWLETQLKARMPKDLRRKQHRRCRGPVTRNEAGLLGHEAREAEASEHRSDQDYLT
jgi:hypothetical protein